MSDPFVGEIRAWAFPWAPVDWAFCNGQTVSIQQFQALFAVIGNLYGPYDMGKNTFTLPDLRGMTPMAAGNPAAAWVAQGLPASIQPGNKLGASTTTLSVPQMPIHTHQAVAGTASAGTGLTANPTGASYVSRTNSTNTTYGAWDNTSAHPNTAMHPAMIGPQGGGQAHENRQPFVTVNFCIALNGDWPSRP